MSANQAQNGRTIMGKEENEKKKFATPINKR